MYNNDNYQNGKRMQLSNKLPNNNAWKYDTSKQIKR